MIEIKEIKKVNEISHNEFSNNFMVARKPVIFKGISHHWPARTNWNLNYIFNSIQKNMSLKIPLTFCYDNFEAEVLLDMNSIVKTLTNKSFSKYSNKKIYLRNWNFWKFTDKLFSDYSIPPIFGNDYSEILTNHQNEFKWIFIGDEDTATFAHYDNFYTSAWLYLHSGQKKWRVLQEDDTHYPPLKIINKGNCYNPYAISLFDDDEIQRSVINNQKIEIWEGIQEPGEIIWIPPKTLHAVKNLEFSIALTHNYLNETNIKYAEIWPLLHHAQKEKLMKLKKTLKLS